MKLLVFTAAFYDRDLHSETKALKASAYLHNIDLKMYGIKETFSFYESKINQMGVFLNSLKGEYTHCLYTDASDSVFVAGLNEIVLKYEKFNHPLVVSAEKSLYPFEELGYLFPDPGTPWRYMNPGNFIGEIGAVLDVIGKLKPYKGLQTNDQGHWMRALEAGGLNIKLDTRCELFQTMSIVEDSEVRMTGSRVHNLVTDTYPCIVHFNGPKNGVNEARRDRLYHAIGEEYHESVQSV